MDEVGIMRINCPAGCKHELEIKDGFNMGDVWDEFDKHGLSPTIEDGTISWTPHEAVSCGSVTVVDDGDAGDSDYFIARKRCGACGGLMRGACRNPACERYDKAFDDALRWRWPETSISDEQTEPNTVDELLECARWCADEATHEGTDAEYRCVLAETARHLAVGAAALIRAMRGGR